MAYYAFLDENNVVTEVIPGKNETQLLDGLIPEEWYGNYRGQRCIRTSFNTYGNIHREGKVAFRKNFASIGMIWDGIGFYHLRPFPSWTLNSESYLWEPPISMPIDDKRYRWDETTTSWIEN